MKHFTNQRVDTNLPCFQVLCRQGFAVGPLCSGFPKSMGVTGEPLRISELRLRFHVLIFDFSYNE